MIRTRIVATLVAAIAASTVLVAQNVATEGQNSQKPAAPAVAQATAAAAPAPLTEVVKLQIQNAAQRVRLAEKEYEVLQLRMPVVAAEYKTASEALQQLIAAAQPPGYQLNEKLELVKLPAEIKNPGK